MRNCARLKQERVAGAASTDRWGIGHPGHEVWEGVKRLLSYSARALPFLYRLRLDSRVKWSGYWQTSATSEVHPGSIAGVLEVC